MIVDHKANLRYARALFGLAKERNEIQKIEKDFTQLAALLKKHPEITRLVINSTISQTEKEDFLDKILPPEFSKTLVQFAKVLVHKRRFAQIAFIQEAFHRFYEEKQGIQEVRVLTPIPLSSLAEEKLIRALKKKLNSDVYLIPETDPGLVGGMILRFGGMEIDASYKNRLLELRQKLME